MGTVTLYGAPLSLYTGRARCYLIKAGIPYQEQQGHSDHFKQVVLPQAGIRTIPTLELEDGTVIRDGAAIIDHYEAQFGRPYSPDTPRQKIVSLLLDVIGAEGLLRPAMHYRWNFPDDNLNFVMIGFRDLFPPGPKQSEMAEGAANKMRQACQASGVTDDTIPAVEAMYGEFLDALNAHLKTTPYLLGGRPSIGDFGLIAPLFAHLGRDPKPLGVMQRRAPHVYRWVERMNRCEADMAEYELESEDYLAGDEVPDSLIDALKTIAEDFVPETLASAKVINQWIAAQDSLASGTPIERGVGFAAFDLRGATCHALSQPYRYYLLSRAQSTFEAMDSADQDSVHRLLDACDMTPLLDCKLKRPIARADNREVWV
ncbi:MAG: glutathione S-transferase family protein [Pseudomonadota bacterium]